MRCARVSLVVLCLGTGGCLTMTAQVKVKPDGSGTLVHTVSMNPQVLTDLGAEAGKGPGPMTRAQAERAAKDLGEGVSLVAFEAIQTPQAVGGRVTLAFKDVNKIKLDQKPDGPGGAPDKKERDALRFSLTRLPNGNSLLRVYEARQESGPAAPAPPGKPDDDAPAGQEAMARRLLKGARVAITVEVDGKLVKASSPYVQGPVVTIFDVDFDALLADEAKLKQLDVIFNGSPEEAKRLLKDVKGIKVNAEREVQIEFSGR